MLLYKYYYICNLIYIYNKMFTCCIFAFINEKYEYVNIYRCYMIICIVIFIIL